MGPIGCLETSVLNQPALRNNPEDVRIQVNNVFSSHDCSTSCAFQRVYYVIIIEEQLCLYSTHCAGGSSHPELCGTTLGCEVKTLFKCTKVGF